MQQRAKHEQLFRLAWQGGRVEECKEGRKEKRKKERKNGRKARRTAITAPPDARTRCTSSSITPAAESPVVITMSHPATTSTAGDPPPAKITLAAPSRRRSGADAAERSQRGKMHSIAVAESAVAGTEVFPGGWRSTQV